MLIQPNEIRIGNYLKHGDILVLVSAIFKTHFNCETTEGITHGNSMQENFSPAILIPEILEKCGFKKDYDGYFTLDIGRKYFSIGIGDQETFVYQPDIGLKAVELNCDCEYLHQFQNLFFSLAGQELEIKNL